MPERSSHAPALPEEPASMAFKCVEHLSKGGGSLKIIPGRAWLSTETVDMGEDGILRLEPPCGS